MVGDGFEDCTEVGTGAVCSGEESAGAPGVAAESCCEVPSFVTVELCMVVCVPVCDARSINKPAPPMTPITI